jgi:hypothetical protein
MRPSVSRIILSISSGFLLATAPALAQTETPIVESVSVVPNQGAPGQTVQVGILCENGQGSNFSSEAITLTSPLAPNPQGTQPLTLFASGVVNDVPPGTFPVRALCEGRQVSTTFTVLPRGAKAPKGAPSTGGGGTASS